MRTPRFRRRRVLALALVLAIPSCAPNLGPVPVGCTRNASQTIETPDNFTPPGPVPYVSPALTSFLAALPSTQQFDENKVDAAFGASFRIDADVVCSVQVDVGVRHGVAGGWTNDGITVGVAPFGSSNPSFYSAVIWQAKDPSSKVLSFNLPAWQVSNYLNGTVPPIDVYLQDDTNVDFIKVSWTY